MKAWARRAAQSVAVALLAGVSKRSEKSIFSALGRDVVKLIAAMGAASSADAQWVDLWNNACRTKREKWNEESWTLHGDFIVCDYNPLYDQYGLHTITIHHSEYALVDTWAEARVLEREAPDRVIPFWNRSATPKEEFFMSHLKIRQGGKGSKKWKRSATR